MLLIITPVNLLSSSTSTLVEGGGGKVGIGYMFLAVAAGCVDHVALASEVAVVDIHSLLANAGIACSYRLSQIPRTFQLIMDNHHVSSDLTLHNQKLSETYI
jgi:hypothetical protein